MTKIKILVVDDEKEIADYIRYLVDALRISYIETEVVYSGSRALEKLKTKKYQIIITDIVMPIVDGFALLEYIAGQDLEMKIVFITSYEEFEYIYRANKLRKIDYLVKTESDDNVQSVIKKVISEVKDSPNETECHGEVAEIENINKIKEYILDHINEDITAASIAEFFHYHPVYLSRMFKQYTNIKLSAFIKEAKINRAKYYLLNTNYAIEKIAKLLGYQSAPAFGRAFRKELSISPQAYRRSFEQK